MLLPTTETGLVKHLPSWTPFIKFHAVGKLGREMLEKMVYAPYEQVKAEMVRSSSSSEDVMLIGVWLMVGGFRQRGRRVLRVSWVTCLICLRARMEMRTS